MRAATATGNHSIAIGAGSYAQGNWAIAQGTKSLAYGLGSLAIGTGAKAGESTIEEWNNTQATAIGYDANASKKYSTAIGTGSEATAEGATAVGQQAAANAEGSVAVGTNSLALTNGAIAVGSSSMAIGNGSITIGVSAQSGFYAEDLTKGENGVAIGNVAWIPEAKNAVALGYGSVALEDAVVSVGSDGTSVTISGDDGEETIETQKITRRIVNVANGTKNTDAATVGQLVKNDTYVYDATTKTIKVKTNGDTGTEASGFTLDLSTLSTGGDVSTKVNTDASNIGANLKDSAGNPASASDVETNLNAWGTALGTGTVSAASGQLVTGATVYNETRKNVSGTYISSGNDVGTNLSLLDTQVKTNADAISEIEKSVTAQQKVISYDKDSGIIGIGTNSDIVADTVTIAGTSGNRTLTGLKDGVNANDAATVGQMNTAITKAISGNTYSGDGVTIEVDSATRTISAKTGAVSSDNDGLVTGATVYEAVEKSKVDGASYTIDANKRTATVLNKDGSTAFTLTVEGSAAGAYTSGDHIYISDDSTISVKTDGKIESGNTGIVTGGAVYEKIGDTSKLTAAGLGDTLSDSVLGVNERVLSVNNRMNDLANDINKVGAGAAALAALRPEGFSPDDKWSFAVGYGHYKNANSGAFGAFYKPNQDTTISAGSTIGNGNPMMNLGFSFKLGTRSAGPGIYSSNLEIVREMNAMKAGEERMAEVIHAQAQQISNLVAENAQMKAQIAEILKKLELSAAVQKAM